MTRNTLSVKEAAVLIGVHSTAIYKGIYQGKLQVVPGIKPCHIFAWSFARFQRLRQAKRALAQEERALAQEKRNRVFVQEDSDELPF